MSSCVLPRDWLVHRLNRNLSSTQTFPLLKRILVVGGGPSEPELALFDGLGIEKHFAGVNQENSEYFFQFLDLNKPADLQEKYDLVICNQVLEHLYNLDEAFKNLEKLVQPKGLLWITCPASNFRHGSPEYFSAGYTWEFLTMNLESLGFKTIDAGELSSKRIYLYRHLLKLWPNRNQIKFPFMAVYRHEGSVFQGVKFNVRTFLVRLSISFSSRSLVENGEFPLETFGFFEKDC